jgi:GDPmannose 4,6-dehydratase
LKTAIITGISGQDGAYLSRLLLGKGYRVIGLVRSSSGSDYYRLRYLGVYEKIKFLECDLCDLSQVIHIITSFAPDEIYNLAAQSSVSLSFNQPIGTIEFNIHSVLNILEAIRISGKDIRLYQASSSEMFGKVQDLPIRETTAVHPLSPYAISKVTGHYICMNYRESYNLYACSGILFNHESYLRGEGFFVKKLIRGALDIKHGQREQIEFGNIDIRRDFGWSEKYVEAMWLLLQQKVPEDYLICSGKSVSLREIVNYVFDKLGISKDRMTINQSLFRPTEIEDIYGSTEKARRDLGWHYDLPFFAVIDNILAEEEKNYSFD